MLYTETAREILLHHLRVKRPTTPYYVVPVYGSSIYVKQQDHSPASQDLARNTAMCLSQLLKAEYVFYVAVQHLVADQQLRSVASIHVQHEQGEMAFRYEIDRADGRLALGQSVAVMEPNPGDMSTPFIGGLHQDAEHILCKSKRLSNPSLSLAYHHALTLLQQAFGQQGCA